MRVQQYIMGALDPQSIKTVSATDESKGKGACAVILFDTQDREAQVLTDFIGKSLSGGLRPREMCILVRNRAEAYARPLLEQLQKAGIKARVEAELQDLFAEPLAELLLLFLRLSLHDRTPAEWQQAMDCLCGEEGEVDGRTWRAAESSLVEFCTRLRDRLMDTRSEADLRVALIDIVAFVGEVAFKLDHPQYRQGDLYDKTLSACAHHLWERSVITENWTAAVADFEGVDTIPVMTIHKSKGLEYRTVIFLGLEDGAFWSFRGQEHEETCAFFVAFSRAKQCVLFTFSRIRTEGPGRGGFDSVQHAYRCFV